MSKRDNVAIFNLECTPAMREQIEVIRERIGAASAAEVIRRAIRLFDMVTAPSSQLVVREKDGLARVVIA